MRKAMRHLTNSAIESAPWLCAVARVFERGGAPLYIVGGAVRNPLMGLPCSDMDVCGPARPEAVAAFCKGTPVRARIRAAKFGTVELYAADESGQMQMAEYTTFRKDCYAGGHRPKSVRFTAELSTDALRRDFSVNALYQQVLPDGLGEVIDPVGGMAHLEAGILHTVTDDPDLVLMNDGLRIVRGARFQAELGLTPTPALINSLTRYAPLLADISRERLRDEMRKIMLADMRYPMLPRRVPATKSGLETLHTIGAWPYVMSGAPYDAQAVSALDKLSDVEGVSPIAARMALLLSHCPAGEIATFAASICFGAKECAQVALLADTLERLRADRLSLWDAVNVGIVPIRFAESALEALDDRSALARARHLCAHLARVPLSLRELDVNGKALLPLLERMGEPPSRMSAVLDHLWRLTTAGEVENERHALLAAAERFLTEPDP